MEAERSMDLNSDSTTTKILKFMIFSQTQDQLKEEQL